MGSPWLDWFRAVYPVFVTLVSLAGLACVLWLGTKFASKADAAELKSSQADHETRIKLLEEHMDASPTRQELHNEISGLGERISAVETGLKGIGKQLDTANGYLHSLIEKAIPGARR